MKTCPVCNKEFTYTNYSQKYCSVVCQKKHWKKSHWEQEMKLQRIRFKHKVTEKLSKMPMKVCKECSTTFSALDDRRHPYKIFCSAKCRQKFNNSHRELWSDKKRESRRFSEINRKHRIKANGGNITKAEWLEIRNKHDNKCAHCHLATKLTMDHIKAISNGGRHEAANIQPLCVSCNSKKHTK